MVTISISVVEEDESTRMNLAKLIDNTAGYCCMSSHCSAEDALCEIPRFKPNVVLMGNNLPGITAVECSRQLKPQLPSTQIIILTVFQEPEHVFEAFEAGANGYMLKQTPPAELFAAIRFVYAGGSPISNHIARKIVQPLQQPSFCSSGLRRLSPREKEVLDLLVKGYRYKKISDTLKISYATAHTHIRRLYKKLHVHSNTEAIAKYLDQIVRPVHFLTHASTKLDLQWDCKMILDV